MPDPLRLAFLGCGFITRLHSRNMRRLGREIVLSYASRDAAKAEAFRLRDEVAQVVGWVTVASPIEIDDGHLLPVHQDLIGGKVTVDRAVQRWRASQSRREPTCQIIGMTGEVRTNETQLQRKRSQVG